MARAEDATAQTEAAVAETPAIGEIIVTANRREERAQDVPISSTAMPAESFRRFPRVRPTQALASPRGWS